ncbi:MAG: carboxypeptidase regulatory-like domain-containing protein [Planctomycetes bacterium]|nr:carboxypeptidase regulatory-like domain-containing protein [Planctomycetota bacterium]
MRRPALPVIVLLACLAALALLVARVAHWSPTDGAMAELERPPAVLASDTEPDRAGEAAPLEAPLDAEAVERAGAAPASAAPILAAPDDAHTLVTGIVRERGTGRPVPGALVRARLWGAERTSAGGKGPEFRSQAHQQEFQRFLAELEREPMNIGGTTLSSDGAGGVTVTRADGTKSVTSRPDGAVRAPGTGAAKATGIGAASAPVLTGPDGRFELVVERAPRSCNVLVSATGYGVGVATIDDVSSGRADCVVELDANRTAHGRVLDRARRPVANAQVVVACLRGVPSDSLLPDDNPGSWSATLKEAATDADGRFHVADLDARTAVRLFARSLEHGIAVRDEPSATSAAKDVDFGDVVLGDPFELRGSVVRLWKGEPLASADPFGGITVELWSDGVAPMLPRSKSEVVPNPQRTQTDASGAFSFAGLMPGPYRVSVRTDARGELLASGAATPPTGASSLDILHGADEFEEDGSVRKTNTDRETRMTVSLGAEAVAPVRLIVPRTTTLRGQVLDPELRPAAHARVEAVAPSVVSSASTDADGRFELAGLGRGALHLRVRPAPGMEGVLPETTREGVLPGAGEVQVVLAAATFVAGRVVDGDGKPVAFAGVTVRSSAGKELDFAYTDDAGAFRLRVPNDEAVELEACPSRLKDGKVRTLDGRSPLRARARGVRAGSAVIELALVEAR